MYSIESITFILMRVYYDIQKGIIYLIDYLLVVLIGPHDDRLSERMANELHVNFQRFAADFPKLCS